MVALRFLLSALTIVAVSALTIVPRQSSGVYSVLSRLTPKIYKSVNAIIVLRAKDLESDTTIGDLINKIDNDLNRAISELQNLPPRKRSQTESGEILKRQDVGDIQVLQARIIGDILQSINGLDPAETPSIKPFVIPGLDSILANEINLVTQRIGDRALLTRLMVPWSAPMTALGMNKTKTAVGQTV